MDYKILTFYQYTQIENPQKEVKRQYDALKELDVKARVYIAKNGVNAQMSFHKNDS